MWRIAWQRYFAGVESSNGLAAWPAFDRTIKILLNRTTLSRRASSKKSAAGFSLLELTMTLVVGIILAAVSIPVVQSSLKFFRIRSAVSSVTGAIQSTRYRAIFDGCPYTLTFDNSANTFQIASETTTGNGCAVSFTNVGMAVPLGSTAIAMNQRVTLQFKPSGYVQATTGPTTFTLTYGSTTKTVPVSAYGNINVTP